MTDLLIVFRLVLVFVILREFSINLAWLPSNWRPLCMLFVSFLNNWYLGKRFVCFASSWVCLLMSHKTNVNYKESLITMYTMILYATNNRKFLRTKTQFDLCFAKLRLSLVTCLIMYKYKLLNTLKLLWCSSSHEWFSIPFTDDVDVWRISSVDSMVIGRIRNSAQLRQNFARFICLLIPGNTKRKLILCVMEIYRYSLQFWAWSYS